MYRKIWYDGYRSNFWKKFLEVNMAQEEFSAPGYEQAALQAIAFLQKLYGFVVVDYNFQSVVLYSRVARDAVAVAATGTGILSRIGVERKGPGYAVCILDEGGILT